MSALSAINHCEELRDYYQRKVAQGKNKMSVINAVRNKLGLRIFATVRNNRKYDKNYKYSLAFFLPTIRQHKVSDYILLHPQNKHLLTPFLPA
ncbi:hypothetical protein WJR50_19565 [Catalinimonas sp. 4WD22]|uniref:hypothetical protein n=1 Tax=Catalinimonas locisalis TaxID=3133978 RepID=UPI003100F9F5